MGQQYSKEVLDYRKKSKKEAKKLGFLPNKKAVVHPLNQAPKQTKVSRSRENQTNLFDNLKKIASTNLQFFSPAKA